MKAVCLDFETFDPTLLKYGSGAVLKYHYPEIEFDIIGCGVSDGQSEQYIDFKEQNAREYLKNLLQKYDIWIMHNAIYDLGCLKYIYRENLKIPIAHDTLLMAKLVDQQLDRKIKFSKKPYSLEALAKYFGCTNLKESDGLHDYAWSLGLYQEIHKAATGKNAHTRPSAAVMDRFCKSNMGLFPSDIMGEYCLADARATFELHEILIKMLADYDLTEMSDLIKTCLSSKFRGVRLNLVAAQKVSEDWKRIALESEAAFKLEMGGEFNINSNAQIGPILEAKGIKIPRTALGNYSIKSEWLEEQGNPMLAQLKRYRKSRKAEKDYIQKMFNYQEIIPEKYKEPGIGVMYPTLKPLGATATGRFSSGGGSGSNELNILAISKHDAEFGAPIRNIFIPEPGEQIVCCDFSNQEPRLQVHYAKLLNCTNMDTIIEQWIANPKMKYHQTVSDMTKLPYDTAKMVTLGLAYDMRAWGLSQKLNVPYQRAQAIIEQYYQLLPFMKQLQAICSHSLKKLGYIKTIGGRKLKIDLPKEFKGEMRTQERKAMSKLIQGSGADQIIKAMIAADKRGLKVLFSVHDEIVITTDNAERDLPILQDCMENAYKLVVPVIAAGEIGDSWGSAKPL